MTEVRLDVLAKKSISLPRSRLEGRRFDTKKKSDKNVVTPGRGYCRLSRFLKNNQVVISMWPVERHLQMLLACHSYRSSRKTGRAVGGDDEPPKTRARAVQSVRLEYNGGQNRPVRATVSQTLISELFSGFDPCAHGSKAIEFFSSDLHKDLVAFGESRDTSQAALRGRLVIPMSKFSGFLREFCAGEEITVFERNCLHALLDYAPKGVLLQDMKDPRKIMNREYTKDVYRLAAALLFVDPPGSSVQEFHIDMHGCDRDAVWNLVVPLSMQLGDTPQVAASEFSRSGGGAMCMGEATMWDACWNHQGRGNTTDTPRVYLHLLFMPYFMLAPDPSRQIWHFDDDNLKVYLTEALAGGAGKHTSVWNYIEEIQQSIAAEYNKGIKLHASDSPLASWVEYVRTTRV